MTSSMIASLHYLAFALALGSVFMRGVYLRQLQTKDEVLPAVFVADNLWAASAIFLIATGLYRAFGGLEKGTDYYLQNHHFWAKMGFLILIFMIEVKPMIALIRWRMAAKKGNVFSGHREIPLLRKINLCELILVILIPFFASAMARGL